MADLVVDTPFATQADSRLYHILRAFGQQTYVAFLVGSLFLRYSISFPRALKWHTMRYKVYINAASPSA